MLPPRERVAAQVKVDAAGTRRAPAPRPLRRRRSHRQAPAKPSRRRAGRGRGRCPGSSRLMTRDSRHAADRSISVRGAIGIRSRPSAARRRSSPSGCATSAARWPIARRPLRSAAPGSARRARSVRCRCEERTSSRQVRTEVQRPTFIGASSRIGRILRPCMLEALGSCLKLPQFCKLQEDVIEFSAETIEAGSAVPDAAVAK